MNRGRGLSHNPARAAEKRARRLARRAAEGPRPEDLEAEERASSTPARPRPAREEHDAEASRLWWAAAIAGGCVMCNDCPVDPQTYRERRVDIDLIQGHHPIPQDKLKRWGLRHLLWDRRNRLGLCRYHHFRHEGAVQRVPRRLLRPETFAFADEINARWVLEDDDVYPPS